MPFLLMLIFLCTQELHGKEVTNPILTKDDKLWRSDEIKERGFGILGVVNLGTVIGKFMIQQTHLVAISVF